MSEKQKREGGRSDPSGAKKTKRREAMEYRECQEWVMDVSNAYERLLDEILKLESIEEIRKRIKEFRGEEETQD